ncbi:MAG: helix-turn-helix domain-containing protein [Mariprofundaceae bacterium]
MSMISQKIDKPKNKVKRPKKGWHSVDIKSSLEKQGIRLAALSLDAGYSRNVVSDTINHRWWPAIERVIADALKTKPWILWPDRYNDYGQPVQQGNPNMVKLSHAGRPRNVKVEV